MDPNAPPLSIDVVLTEEAIARDLGRAVEERCIPEKSFYGFPTAARAWIDLCRADGPYRNFARSVEAVEAALPDLAAHLPEGDVEVWSLGAGQGVKDARILSFLRDAGRRVAYRPVDASQTLLEMALAAGVGVGVPSRGLKADIADPRHWRAIAPPAGSSDRLYLLIGNTLGGFEPAPLLAEMAAVLRPPDRVLVDGEIWRGETTVGGYDNPLNRAFAWGPLRALGVSADDGEIRFEVAEDPRRPGLFRLRKEFVARRPVALHPGGEAVSLGVGETLRMGHSCKYTRACLFDILAAVGHLVPVAERTSADGALVQVLARPATR